MISLAKVSSRPSSARQLVTAEFPFITTMPWTVSSRSSRSLYEPRKLHSSENSPRKFVSAIRHGDSATASNQPASFVTVGMLAARPYAHSKQYAQHVEEGSVLVGEPHEDVPDALPSAEVHLQDGPVLGPRTCRSAPAAVLRPCPLARAVATPLDPYPPYFVFSQRRALT